MHVVEEGLVCSLRSKNPLKFMDPGRIHPRAWTELSDVVARPLLIIFGKLVRSGHVPDDWKRANVIPVYKNGPKENPGNYKPINLNFNLNLIPGKVMEQVQLETITNQMNQVTGRSSHDFAKGKSCMTNLIFLQQKKTSSVDIDWSVRWVRNWLTGWCSKIFTQTGSMS